MATIGWVKIGLTTDTSGLSQGLKQGSSMLDAFVGKIGVVGAAIAGAFAVQKVGAGLLSMVNSASDLSENMNKVEAIFGSGSKTVVDAADAMAKAFGTSKNEFLDSAGRMGGLFKGAGMSQQAAAGLSVEFTKLAADAASFFNTDFEMAFMKIRSGLSGESEPLKDFGVLMTEDAVKAQAYAMGLATVGAELTSTQKVQARAAIISKGLADAQGDLGRTIGGAANATRAFWGRITNLSASIGQAFLPAVEKGLAFANQFLDSIGSWAETSGVIEYLGSIIDGFVIAPLQAVMGIVAAVNGVLHEFGVGLQDVFLGALHAIAAVGKGIVWILSSLGLIPERAQSVTDAVKPAQKKATSKTAAVTPKAVHHAAAQRFAGAVEKDSAAAYSAILASKEQFAQAAGGVQSQIASNTSVTAQASVRSAAALEKLAGGGEPLAVASKDLGSKDAFAVDSAARSQQQQIAGQSQAMQGTRDLIDLAKRQIELLKRIALLTERQTAASGLPGLITTLAGV